MPQPDRSLATLGMTRALEIRARHRKWRAPMISDSSAPARLFAEIDAECRLRHDLVDEHRVGRMEAAAAGVTEQALELRTPEHARSAGDFHRGVDDLPSRLDGVMLGRDDLRGPCRAMVDVVAP